MTYDRTDTTINTPVPFLLDDSLYTMYEALVSRLGKLGIFNHLCPVFHIYLSVFFFLPVSITKSSCMISPPPSNKIDKKKIAGRVYLLDGF